VTLGRSDRVYSKLEQEWNRALRALQDVWIGRQTELKMLFTKTAYNDF